jgi:nucleotide sugar dehydrogenase
MRLSVFGLGKIGSPLAAVFASKGHDVIGFDVAAECVRMLASGKAPLQEPHLQELIDVSKGRLSATACYEHAVLNSDVSFVVVPAPSGENGMFTNKNVIAAAEEVGKALRKKPGYHVVNIVTTVMPGSTDGEIREAIEKHSGRRVGDGLGLCYSPEFVALGSVVQNILNPDFILLGASDSKAGDVVENLYRSVCDNNPPIRRMNLINAEIAKLSLNTYLTTKISYANMLADICERLPGADVDVVTSAIGLDTRIGSKYLKGGVSFGGPCFPRDNVAFAALARTIRARADIAEATTRLNSYHAARLTGAVAAPRFFAGQSVRSAFITFVVVMAGLSGLSPSAQSQGTNGLTIIQRTPQTGVTTRSLPVLFSVQTKANQKSGIPNTFAVNISGGAGGTFPGGKNSLFVNTDPSGYAVPPLLVANDTPGSFTVTVSDPTGGSVAFNITTAQYVGTPQVSSPSGSPTVSRTLPFEVAHACAGSTTTFASGVTGIIRVTDRMRIDNDLTIQGPGTANVAVDGGNTTRLFYVGGGNVNISGLTLQNGLGGGGGAGLTNALNGVPSPSAANGTGGWGGGDGALINSGTIKAIGGGGAGFGGRFSC